MIVLCKYERLDDGTYRCSECTHHYPFAIPEAPRRECKPPPLPRKVRRSPPPTREAQPRGPGDRLRSLFCEHGWRCGSCSKDQAPFQVMNAYGVDGCRKHRDAIIQRFEHEARMKEVDVPIAELFDRAVEAAEEGLSRKHEGTKAAGPVEETT